ncbi:carboxypeptidase-like regulatory domain-containing protein [Rufibacter sediminis]|uniref:Carboxypeptidase-like regulatory domain-containing protein n=1 Tax=Rufibacter sediminis TaxID=2762756 RepID=A0ABR6VP14_9BACT|nr:carboxypeptidase-like regulatory domain-containing protein [Rufibacter sediminis]MBC3538902.1 carboxypeptidase-like regulatory domain-containing protein [Rufibacter sediminis]
MSKRFCFIFLFLIGLLGWRDALAQTSGHSIWVSGLVLREDTKKPIPGVSVYLKSTGQGLATNEQGAFRINISPSDTVVFRALGFREKLYVPSLRSVTELRVNILLQEESVQLKEVRVSPLSPEKVDRVLRNMKPRPAPPKPRMNVTVPRIIIPPGPPAPPDLITSPLSFLYEQFSKEGKQRSRLAKLMEERERQKELERIMMRQDSIRQARLRYNRFFRDTTSFYDPRW